MAQELSLKEWQVEHTLQLLEEGATVPFVSRYRKERTGSLDEVEIGAIKLLGERYKELEKRKEAILESIASQDKLTDALRQEIEDCYEMNRLEDLYLPYRPKRKTRASVAKEKGLEPLAVLLLAYSPREASVLAQPFVNEAVPDVEAALAGARDIVAEQLSERADLRDALRRLYQREAWVFSHVLKGKDEEAENFRNYFDFKEPLRKIPSHRLMAILRGHAEGFLGVKVEPESSSHTLDFLERLAFPKKDIPPHRFPLGPESSLTQLHMALEDGYKRLIHPSIENESLNTAKEKADTEAIKVFADNLGQLLLAPPLGQKRVLALDPGFRTGCKMVCLDAQGQLLHNDTIYPHPPQNDRILAMKKLTHAVEAYKIEVIAVGNGTAGRETEQFLRKIAFPAGLKIYAVSEDGASVYSASSIAREEFPEYDVTVRGAVSIGRRIMDPLAELVKIDPKAIGVGQYQHDVDQGRLKESLDLTVEHCVNHVGVNLNTASKHLLTYISGLGPQLAQNIVDYRSQHGAFARREQIMEVKRLGNKAFEQCAGFLRIPGGDNPLDNSAVHPERYALVARMASDLGLSVADFMADEALRKQVDLKKYVSEDVGLPTLQDIMDSLSKIGRDPRASIKVLEFAEGISGMEDLHVGMELPGIVTNITNFGAFVDIGIKQDGLVHVSQIADKYISHPGEVLKLHQHVKVRVVEVDVARKRIQLSMKGIK